ncbi:MAG TPA: MarR family transcriptional regulator [Microbacteriaceae bacterium]|nr:MarR family transcriptional regulator [Microbacteriaceae bacterium]
MPSPNPTRPAAPHRKDARRLLASGLGENFAFLLSRAGVLTTETANAAVEPLGISIQEYMVLSFSTVSPPPSQRELSQVLRLDPSRIVGLVDRLEQAGLVQRLPSPTDRRVKQVVPTDTGQRLSQQGAVILAEVHAQQFAGLQPEEIAALSAIVRRIAL